MVLFFTHILFMVNHAFSATTAEGCNSMYSPKFCLIKFMSEILIYFQSNTEFPKQVLFFMMASQAEC